MAVTETKTGSWYGIATYGTEQWSTASNTLAVDESVSSTASVGSVTLIEGVGITAAPSGVSGATTINDDLHVLMVFTPDSVSATGVVNTDQNDLYDGFRVNTNFANAYYGQGVYGASIYGDTSAPTEVLLSSLQGSGNVTGVTVAASSDTTLEISVFAEIITDATAVIGDEVTVVADAVLQLDSVSGTSEITNVSQRTENTVIPTGVSASNYAGTADVAADSNVSAPSTDSTGQVGDGVTLRSVYSVTGVTATGVVDEDEIVGNNAIPTMSGVSAGTVMNNVTVSTTAVIFNVANKDHHRTTFVEADKPRIVYVRAA